MKIDLHCHTLKAKDGDGEARNVTPEKFVEVMKNNNVRIAAITNHNIFNKEQYLNISEKAAQNDIQVWPGIEFDIKVNDGNGINERGHIIFVTSPTNVDEFDIKVNNITRGTNPNDFVEDIHTVLNIFDCMQYVIIAHYLPNKNDGFSNRACDFIKTLLSNKPLLLEPSNLKRLGIMYAENYNGFIGSDVKDWDNYPSNKIPSLKIDIKNYDTFESLLRKNPQVLESFLDQKITSEIKIKPFLEEGDEEELTIPIKQDVNIIFGGKGTGKSKIINALKTYYVKNYGSEKVSYYEGQTKEEDYKKLTEIVCDDSFFDLFRIDDCKKEIESLKKWSSPNIVSISKFRKAYDHIVSGKVVDKIKINNTSNLDILSDDEYQSAKNRYTKIKNTFASLLQENLSELLDLNDLDCFKNLMEKIELRALDVEKENFKKYYALYLTKKTIKIMQDLIKVKTGNESIPMKTGLVDVFIDCLNVYKYSKKIYDNLSVNSISKRTDIGFIDNKGKVFIDTKIFINPDEDTKVKYKQGIKCSDLKAFKHLIKIINDSSFNCDNSENLAKLTEKYEDITTIKTFIGIKNISMLHNQNGTDEIYQASSGEKSMIMLSHELLDTSKEYYILDEPELSLGHKYINEVIVPQIKFLSDLNKTIIISTHDANIAVRTYPLVSIYRERGKTYIGSLFLDQLKFGDKVLNWTRTSMDYLEGGENAFDERGLSYGKNY